MRMCAIFIAITLSLTTFVRGEDGERYALLIGVNEYNANSNLTALKYAETDMTQLAKALVDAGFKAENIRLMIQGEITDARFKPQRGSSDQYKPRKQNIENELDLLLKQKRPDDTLVIAFAGHGLQYRDKDEVYYCPADAKVTDVTTLVELTGVVNLLKDSPAGAKLMIADCCRNNPLEEGLRADLGLKVESATRMVRIKPPESVATLFSCGKGEFAREEKDFNGGVFTHYLVEGLRGKAAQNGVVEIAGLASYVQYNVYEYVRKKYTASQTPDYKLNLGRPMILARGLKPKTETAPASHVAALDVNAPGQTHASSTRAYRASGNVRLLEAYNTGQSRVTDTEAAYEYSWQVSGAQRTLSMDSARMKREIGGQYERNYFIDKQTAWGIDAGGNKINYTDVTLPVAYQNARKCLNVPLYNVQLDDAGKVASRSPLVNQLTLSYLEAMEWNVADMAVTPLQPFVADQDEWQTDAEFGLGSNQIAKGKMTLKKVPGGEGGQAVKVACTYTHNGFTHPLTNIYYGNIVIKTEGVQVYDAENKEWIGGQYRTEMTFQTPICSLKSVSTSKLEKR